MAEPASVSPSSIPDVNALLTGYKWNTTELTYSFPDSGWWYVLEEVIDDLDFLDVLEVLVDFVTDPVGSLINVLETALLGPFADTAIVAIVALNGFQEFNAAQQDAAEAALKNLESFTLLEFTEVEEGDFTIDYDDLTGLIPVGFGFTHGTIRYGETASTEAPAFGIPPLPRVELLIGPSVLGDTWYKNDGQFDNAAPGNFAAFTILHETGHAMGLKHAHEEGLFGGRIPEWLEAALTDTSGPIISAEHNSLEFTAMSYVSAIGGGVGYTNADDSYPTTFMMYDILALQHMYGANFNYNAGDTVYSWNRDTGEFFIDGVGQGAPAGNKVFMTIWDGNGNDTYDLSTYLADASIDLAPGKWSITSAAQRAVLNDNDTPTSSDDTFSRGTVFNSLLFNDDTRSLIENANGGAGNDAIKGNDVANVLRGNAGNDNIEGFLGADTLEGGDNNDTLNGGDGNDDLEGGGGNDSLTGGEGDDSLQGEGGDDTISGGNGVDTVFGGDDNDTIDGGADNDVLAGELGDDSVLGGDGDDFITGAAGLDSLGGGAGADSLDGGDDNDTIDGGDGSDLILAGAGDDTAFGGVDADTIVGDAGADTIHGDGGNDNIDGGLGDDALHGDDGDDTIFGRAGRDIIVGGAGADSLDAGDDNDTAFGGDGDDTILGGNGDDTLGGDGGNDLIHGGDGIDTISGGTGNDNLFGEAENDSLFGNEGDDTLAGGAGADLLNGGDGIDMASYSDATGPVVINLQDPTQTTGDAAGDVLISIEKFGLSEFDDTFIGLDDPLSGDVVFGRGGNDTLLGFAGDDELHGEAGDDFLVGGEGADIIDGGTGFDTTSFVESNIGIIVDLIDPSRNTGIAEGDTIIDVEQFQMTLQNDEFVGSGVDETIHAYHGNDNISGGGGNDLIFGGEQHDVLSGDAGDDTIWGEAGDDIVLGGAGNDSLDGGLGIDDVRGGTGNDSLWGGDDNDRLNGGEGDDQMWGGVGRDLFVYAATNWGEDRIFGFEDRIDRIEITGLAGGPGIHAMDDLHIFERMGADGIETVIESAAGGSDEIVLAGIRTNQINHQDFIFLA